SAALPGGEFHGSLTFHQQLSGFALAALEAEERDIGFAGIDGLLERYKELMAASGGRSHLEDERTGLEAARFEGCPVGAGELIAGGKRHLELRRIPLQHRDVSERGHTDLRVA